MTTPFDEIYDDYRLLHLAVVGLPERHFKSPHALDPPARKRAMLLESIALDTSFKLLACLEASLRDWALRSTHRGRRKKGDAVGHVLRRSIREIAKRRRLSPGIAVRELPIEQLLLVLRDHFRARGDALHRTLSLAKGYFKSFRNWYAHGRSGKPKSKPPDVEEILNISLQISGVLDA